MTLAPIGASPYQTGGLGSTAIALNPSGTRVYVGNPVSNDVSVLDAVTLALVQVPFITGGNIPVSFAFGALISPPSNLRGSQKKNDFALVFEQCNFLTWHESASIVAGYNIYRNGALIASIGPQRTEYQDHGQEKGVSVLYAVTAFNAGGIESAPITVIVQ